MKTFAFEPEEHSRAYGALGFVHAKGGVTPEFLNYARDWVRTQIGGGEDMKDFEFRGKKRQFLFDFSPRGDFPLGVYRTVAAVSGLSAHELTLCERHIKVYDADAPNSPPPHKDRVASEVAVGITLSVDEDSYLVLYPDVERDINPFNTTALWRSSLDEERLPERVLQPTQPVEIFTAPGDVVIFRGSSIYHERVKPRGSVVLYLKFNSMHLDPIGEDPSTLPRRERSLALLEASGDQELLSLVPQVSPKLWQVSRHYTRLHWKEVIQAYVTDAKEFGLSEQEFRFLQLVDGQRPVRRLIELLGVAVPDVPKHVPMIRRLCRLQAIDLLG